MEDHPTAALMDPAYRINRVRADGERLLEAAYTDLNAQVPACEGWRNEDLLAHIARVWTAIARQVEQPSKEPIRWKDLPNQTPAVAFEKLSSVLAKVAPKTPLQRDDHTVASLFRRVQHETAIHRVDAEQAIGAQTSVPAQDGIDGVDELYSQRLAKRETDLPDGSLHLHQVDGDGEFMLAVVDQKIEVTHKHAKGDAAIRATGEELFLCAWGRRSLQGLTLFGDVTIAQQWLALAP